MTSIFDDILNRYAGQNEMRPQDNMLVLFIFYCCFKYKFQLCKNVEWLSQLIGLHRTNNYEYYESKIANFFRFDNQLE